MGILYGVVIFAVLLILQMDQSRGLSLLSPGQHLLLFLLMGLVAWGAAKRPRREGSPFRPLLLLGLLLGCLLSGLGLASHLAMGRLHETWLPAARARLEAPRQEIRAAFRQFALRLAGLPSTWNGGRVPEANRSTRFRRLRELADTRGDAADRFGWTLWTKDRPDSWAGRTMASLAPEEIPGPEGLRIVQRGAAFVLVSTRRLPAGFILQGEYLLQSPLEKQPYLPLPALEEARRDERVSLRLPPLQGAGLRDDAAPGALTEDERWEEPPRGPAVLTFPLRDASGRPLMVVTIQDRREEGVRERIVHRTQALGLGISFLFLLASASLLLRRAPRASFAGAWLLGSSLFLWGARLLPLGFHDVFHGIALFDPELFASGLAWDLLKSPGDIFLTALFLATSLGVYDRWVATRSLRPTARRLLIGIQLVGLLLLAIFLLRMAWDAPRDARFDLLKVEFSASDAPRLLVQGSLFLLFFSWVTAARTLSRLLRSSRDRESAGRPLPFPAAARLYGWVAAAVLLYLPVVAVSTTQQREEFFLRKLLKRVESHQKERRDALWAALRTLHDSGEVGEVLRRYGPGSWEGASYEIWAAARLDEIGLSSSLRVFSGDGVLLGRFALNLPSRWESRYPPSSDQASVRSFLTPAGTSRKRVLVGETARRGPSGEILRFQIHLLDEYESLPFLRADYLYVQLFPRPRTQDTNPELLGSEPLVAAYDPEGRSLYSSLDQGPDLPPAATALAPRQARWETVRGGENTYRVLFKRLEDRLVAVGFILPSRMEQIGAFVRATLLGFLASAALALLLRLAAPATGPPGRHQGPFFRRLVALILAASLIPLLLLSFFLHRFVMREINEDIRTEGLASLGVARRVVKDYLTARPGAEEARVDDDVVFWLSQVVRQDLNLYSGELLSATSAREVYSSGLLPLRLDPRVYERLVLKGEAYALGEERMGGLSYQTVSAPVSPAEGTQDILSLPLAEKRQEILRKRADVEEAILIVTVGMLLLLTVLAHFLARRVSEPVVALAAASRRIEAGDFDAEVRVPARDEPALLIESFNRMAASLRRQREDLRRRSDYIEKILLNATTGVISLDPSGRLVTMNPAARLLLGLPGTSHEGKEFGAILEATPALAPLRRALEHSDARRERTWQIPLAGEGTPASLRVVSLPFRETPESPAGRILLLEDLTEAVRSSRLEAWAEMARRIAHEIKNPLTPIQLSADHLRRIHRSGDPRFDAVLEECLDTILNQVRSLRRIAAEFSDYARIPQVRKERLSTPGLVNQVLAPYRAAPPPGIRLESSVVPGTPDLFVDPALTRGALVNLIQNALEAMPEGGLLGVSAERGPRPAGEGAGEVRICISDSGPGMDPATLARLFEPYFSTKETGTGLGLSIVRKTVEEQGGRVAIESSPASGTRVILDLPAAPEIGPESAPSAPGTGQPAGPPAL